MILDPPTVAVLSALIVTLCGITFVATTVLRFPDGVGRLFSVAYVAMILMAVLFVVASSSPGAGWAVIVSNATFVAGLGLIYTGLRAARGLRPLLAVPAAAGILVAVADTTGVPTPAAWDDYALLVSSTALALLIAQQALSPPLRSQISARILAVVFGMVAAYQAARFVVKLALGGEHPLYTGWFSQTAACVALDALIVVATIALALLQAERASGRPDRLADTTMGVVGPLALRDVGDSWLRVAADRGRTLTLFVVEILNLDEIGTAFGRGPRASTFHAVDELVRNTLPLAALLGRSGPTRTAALVALPSEVDDAVLAACIERDALRAIVDEADRFRAAVRVVAVPARSTTSVEALLASADALLVRARDHAAPSSPRSSGLGATTAAGEAEGTLTRL